MSDCCIQHPLLLCTGYDDTTYQKYLKANLTRIASHMEVLISLSDSVIVRNVGNHFFIRSLMIFSLKILLFSSQ